MTTKVMDCMQVCIVRCAVLNLCASSSIESTVFDESLTGACPIEQGGDDSHERLL